MVTSNTNPSSFFNSLTESDISVRILISTSNKAIGDKIDLIRVAWLHAKEQRSHSLKTSTAYREILDPFRAVLNAAGLDLDGDITTIVALAAQGWSAQSTNPKRKNISGRYL